MEINWTSKKSITHTEVIDGMVYALDHKSFSNVFCYRKQKNFKKIGSALFFLKLSHLARLQVILNIGP